MINIDEFWYDVKEELSKILQTVSYEIWIDKLEPVCFLDNRLVLSTVSAMSKKEIDARYLDKISEIVTAFNPSITGAEVILETQRDEFLKKQDSVLDGEGFVIKEKLPSAQKNPFLEKYTFEYFIQGKSNAYALAAAKTVAENPGGKYNPLFIYSGVGLGKTHLLHAIGNYILKHTPKEKVLCVNSETMVNDLIAIMRNQKSNEEANLFREKYRGCDVLMVDDIQFLSGKDATQEAFFHIFNDLYQQNKQIILTSDRAPKDLPTLEERLRTRFSWGLTVDIQVPDIETRVAILRSKAAQEKFNLSDEVAFYIAENATSNIRDMEGLLNKIIFFSSLTNHVIDSRSLAEEALQDSLSNDKKDAIDASDIVAAVSKYFKITTADLFGKKKTKNIVEPRMIAIYLITEMLSIPLVSIGQMFGGRDHTTIIHARDKIAEEMKTHTRIKIVVSDIKNMLLNR